MFLEASLTLILQQNWLLQHERQLLTSLFIAMREGNYWDELSRMAIRNPDTPMIIENIVAKCKQYGLQPVLEHLKEHYDHRSEV